MDADFLAKAEVDKNNLQNDLLTAVKECQKKYGGRVELATELDVFVSRICYCFESIFNHGLRKVIPKYVACMSMHFFALVSRHSSCICFL